MIKTRYELSKQRIKQVVTEESMPLCREYFKRTAEFLQLMDAEYSFILQGGLQHSSLEELKMHNRRLYEDILPENYEMSYANPVYAVARLGEEYGRLLSFLYTEMRSLIPYVYEQDMENMVIRMELFLEIYTAFSCAFEETKALPDYDQIKGIVYWFVSDYSETQAEQRIKEMVDPGCDFARRLILESDLEDSRYLYRFGEYVSHNAITTAKHLAALPEETIRLMADTYTEGYRIGFQTTGKDISKKKTVNVRYSLGFERVIRAAVENFEKMGLQSVIYRAGATIFCKKSVKTGYFGDSANKQYDFDHKEDEALYLDKQLMNRKVEVYRNAFETHKKWAAVHGGPAVMEIFGEVPFAPVSKKEACRMSEVQQKLSVEYASKTGSILNEYINGEERSYTIIAFPVPEIGEQYEEIFDEVIKINTLDYSLYQRIQQQLIDVLDQGKYVLIKGMGCNRTDMKVMLRPLRDGSRETIFENCVADVNIPVGEVFTSPQLEGTEGILSVSRVFLNDLEYRELEITFREGRTENYCCRNFETEEENQKYIKDNILFHHDSLPLGEFAIGTNTTAYMVAQKYDIADTLPILIAEKMGPHFAVGDTCYSHQEEVKLYNPDGKEIVAKDNSVSILRTEMPEKAYFNCHTDITIPYDELGEITVVTMTGEEIPVIREGRFVLEGCQELNKPFENK